MKKFEQFHDGFYNGLRIEGKSVALFLETFANERHVLLATGVVALRSDEIRAGNIVFDVVLLTANEIGLAEIREVYGLDDGEQDESDAQRFLAKAQEEGSSFLTITPSYGGSSFVLAKAFAFMGESQWLAKPTMGTTVVE